MSFTEYIGYDSCGKDDAVVFPRDTSVEYVMRYCVEHGYSGFSRNSMMTGRGKFYVRSKHKDAAHLESRLKPHRCCTFWIRNV
jgi:hypothetical protein